MVADSELLRQYVETGAEEAFAELVRRNLNLVYSAALRQVNGDVHLAQDVAQSVFADLARKAGSLYRRPVLAGWLYTSTHFAAAKARRAAFRRHSYEQEAQQMQELLPSAAQDVNWEKLGPALDAAMHDLKKSERELLLRRYFENCRLAGIGSELGLSEDAVRKRLERALEKLRGVLRRRGITTTASLASVLCANAVQVAPAGLAAGVTSAALAGGFAGTGVGFGIFNLMAMTKLKAALAGALVIAAAMVPVRMQQRHVKLQRTSDSLQRQLAQLQTENENLSNEVARARSAQAMSKEQLSELLRLRGEAGRLRQQAKELAASRTENQARHAPTNGGPDLAATLENQTPAPFQIRLVVDDPDEAVDTVTNNVQAAIGGAAPETLRVRKTPLMDSTSIQSASAVTDALSGAAHVEVILTEEGRELFAQATKANLNKRLAIMLDGQSYSAPTIKGEITGGKVQITGSFTEEQAQEFASKINQAIASH